MDENVYKAELKKIKIKKRQMETKLEGFMSKDVSLLDSNMFDNHLKSIDAVCHDVTDTIDELIIDLEDDEEDSEAKISELEKIKKQILTRLKEANNSLISTRSKDTIENKKLLEDENESDQTDKMENMVQHFRKTEFTSDREPNKLAASMGKTFLKKGVIKLMEEEEIVEEGVAQIASEVPTDPTEVTEVVLELVLGSIGQQLGIKGTMGFMAAALTHYTVSQFAVLIGVATSPIKMDFSGITQAKILKKLEDLNHKVDKIVSGPRKEALAYLRKGLIELRQDEIDFVEAKEKFQEVRKLAEKAITLEEDFTNFAVCAKYLLFAETMVQSFTEKGKGAEEDCFLPVEKLSKVKKNRMAAYLTEQVKDLKKQAATKGRKKEDHKEKIDDVLKMVYNIISVCKDLSNPNTPVDTEVTFGVDTDYVPFEEEDATSLQVGRNMKGTNSSSHQEIKELDVKKIPAYIVYLWRSDNMLYVRRELKYFEIPLRAVHGSLIWVKLDEKSGKVICQYGPEKVEHFSMTANVRNGYPDNIQDMEDLFNGAKSAKNMGNLEKPIYEQMQRISELYLADLQINIDEKDTEGNTLLHYVACLKPGWLGSFDPIECLVDAGANLASTDSEEQTPLMAALLHPYGKALEQNVMSLIHHCEGNPALNAVDKRGNNVLHHAAQLKEAAFTKNLVQILLKSGADATSANNTGFTPSDWAKKHQNWNVKKMLDTWMKGG